MVYGRRQCTKEGLAIMASPHSPKSERPRGRGRGHLSVVRNPRADSVPTVLTYLIYITRRKPYGTVPYGIY